METQKPVQQPADVWVKRLLSGLWAAANIFGLQPPDPDATNKQIIKRSASFYEELSAAHESDYANPTDILARQLKYLTKRPPPADLEMSPPLIESVDPSHSLEKWRQFRQEHLLWLGNAHVLFSFQQFAFLYDGFFGIPTGHRFRFKHLVVGELPKKLSPVVRQLIKKLKLERSTEAIDLLDFAFRITLSQIATDLISLSRASVHHSTFENSVITNRVREADLLTLHARESMRAYLPKPMAALTYVDRAAKVRVVPYAPIALIGIPASSLALARDLLAIAHEFGHFLYWNGKTGKAQLSSFRAWIKEEVQDQEGKLSIAHWLEEIFADVVGCLIGGPATALSFQDMTLEKVGGLFLEDSGKHPIPAVRPFIHLYVLDLLNMPNAAAGLRTRWEYVLRNRLGDQWREQPLIIDEQNSERLDDVRSQLESAAKRIFDFFAADNDKYTVLRDRIWSPEKTTPPEGPNDPTWLDAIYTSFETALPQGRLIAEDAMVIDSEQGWKELVVANAYLGIDSLHVEDGTPETSIEPEKWLEVLLFDGWNTEGPGGGVPHLD